MFDTDVFVIGGGPAGLAAAIAASRSGFRVLLADAAHPPIDKTCGEGLMPDSLSAAQQLGISIPAAAGHTLQGIHFHGSTHSVSADFPDAPGVGLRRTVLHKLLAAAAEEAGVKMVWGCPVIAGRDGHLVLDRKPVRARWVIGADGSQSRIRRWAELESFRRDSRRFSYRRHFRVAPWSRHVEIYWGGGCQFYVTPVDRSEISVVLITRDPKMRIQDILPRFPRLHARICPAEPVGPERGALAASRTLRRVTKGQVALVGDASGTVDPITGEGLGLAFKQAFALAHALRAGDLGLYEKAHIRIARRSRFMADFMLLMDRSAVLQSRALAAFEHHPHLFANLLAMHIGQLSPMRFAMTAGALGWRVVTAGAAIVS